MNQKNGMNTKLNIKKISRQFKAIGNNLSVLRKKIFLKTVAPFEEVSVMELIYAI